ncbi:PilZ domain-containing protein [Novosphingobium flavum]|uniref:PilZ domain-containing protein n=2 Tax=Novosphingobium flavum TaxID=1778672 RepID=A0A7X1KN84_9SPHN|nr:PilZ domain-containing protein [Novosphingobium flavum]
MLVRVQVAGGEGEMREAMTRDISATGMSAVARGKAPPAGEVVEVTLPDGSVLWGMVRWSEAAAFGVEFDPASRQGPVAGNLAG